MNRRRFFMLSACAIGGRAMAETPVRWRSRALGAEVQLTLYTNATLAGEAIRKTENILKRAEQNFSLYDKTSALCTMNRDKTLRMSADFRSLLGVAQDIHIATEGFFDPSVQSIFEYPEEKGEDVRFGSIRLLGDHIILKATQSLTFNGIAQGFATDQVRLALEGLGLSQVLVNMGEYGAVGGPWSLGIADPLQGLFEDVTLTDRSIATSSPNALAINGKPHILNPVNLREAQFSTLSVISDTAVVCDALSTGLVYADDRLIQKVVSSSEQSIEIIGLRMDGQKAHWKTA